MSETTTAITWRDLVDFGEDGEIGCPGHVPAAAALIAAADDYVREVWGWYDPQCWAYHAPEEDAPSVHVKPEDVRHVWLLPDPRDEERCFYVSADTPGAEAWSYFPGGWELL